MSRSAEEWPKRPDRRRTDRSNNLAWLSLHSKPILLLVMSGALLIAAILIGTAFMVSNFRERALAASERELQNTVLLLTRHFEQQIEDFEAVQRNFSSEVQQLGIRGQDDFRRRMATVDIHFLLKSKANGSSDVAGINLYDSDGTLINSSESWPVRSINVADRRYFKAFKAQAGLASVTIELVKSRFSGGWAAVVCRKLVGPDGEFLGVIGRGIDPAEFQKFFASIVIADDASVSIFHRDGTMFARYPHVEEMIGRNFVSSPAFDQVLAKSERGAIRLMSPVDGQDRLAAAQASTKFPIATIATTTVSSALAEWRSQTRFLVGVAVLSVATTVLILSLIVRQLSRQHREAQQRLSLEKQKLDTAVNNMTHGLLLFDSSERLVLYNQRYIEMFGLSTDIVRPGCSFRDLMRHRHETGTFVGDVEAYCSALVKGIADGTATKAILTAMDGRATEVRYQALPAGGWVTTMEDITHRRRSEQRIAYLAHHDALTELPNRVLFREELERRIAALSSDEHLALLYIDLDKFKNINDTLGHPVGDELLKEVTRRLRGCISGDDLVARLGGDEFAIVRGPAKTCGIEKLVEALYDAMRAPCDCLGHRVSAEMSIGVALAPEDGSDLDQLLRNADLAMYAAKTSGRRGHRFFEAEMRSRTEQRRALERDLRLAVANNQFLEAGLDLHYQPVAALQDGRIVGCEALLRWRHPDRGFISPAECIDVAEESGLISQLGEWILRAACAEAARWPRTIKLAVNISPVQLMDQAFSLKTVGILAESGLQADRLELEITEAVLVRDDDTALTILHHLKALGVKIALDDFGTGYSSLSYLQRFPFDKIKIDRCFVHDVTNEVGRPIVEAVMSIASARDMTTTAEGVETERQRETLKTMGCAEIQGYLLSSPQPAEMIRQWLVAYPNAGWSLARSSEEARVFSSAY